MAGVFRIHMTPMPLTPPASPDSLGSLDSISGANSDSEHLGTSPPPYEARPKAEWVGVPKSKGKGPILFLELYDELADFGSFLSGSVAIRPRQDMTEPFTVIVSITHGISTYKSSGFLGQSFQTTQNRVKLCKSKIYISEPLAAGYQYTVPFTIRFPDEVALPPCSCHHKYHLSAPPSLGSHETSGMGSVPISQLRMDYAVQAYIRKKTPKVAKGFLFRPRSTGMSLAPFCDASGSKLLREHCTESRVGSRLRRSSKLVVSGWPIYHDANLPSNAQFELNVKLEDAATDAANSLARVQCIDYTITKRIFASPDGVGSSLGGCREDVKHSFEVVKAKSIPTVVRSGRDMTLNVPYEIPPSVFPLVPSHAGCYTAVVYDMALVVHHTGGISRLTLPLVINNCTNPPPSYAAVTPSSDCDQTLP